MHIEFNGKREGKGKKGKRKMSKLSDSVRNVVRKCSSFLRHGRTGDKVEFTSSCKETLRQKATNHSVSSFDFPFALVFRFS